MAKSTPEDAAGICRINFHVSRSGHVEKSFQHVKSHAKIWFELNSIRMMCCQNDVLAVGWPSRRPRMLQETKTKESGRPYRCVVKIGFRICQVRFNGKTKTKGSGRQYRCVVNVGFIDYSFRMFL